MYKLCSDYYKYLDFNTNHVVISILLVDILMDGDVFEFILI